MITPSIIVSPDAELAVELEQILRGTGQTFVARTLERYPEERELIGVLRAHAPQIVFLSVASLEDALRIASAVEAHSPGVQILAVDRASHPRTLLELMRAGIREFVAIPDGIDELPNALLRLNEALQRRPPSSQSTDLLFAFLPAKPGVGCSIVALNTAIAMAAEPDASVLLADFDLTCGTIGFMLHLEDGPSITDAAEHAAHLDEALWPQLVQSRGKLDFLGSGYRNQGFRIETAQIRYLLEFARRNYKAICVDLSGLMERYSVDLMQEAKRICLVTTPELPSLHLARAKLELLRTLELEPRIDLVVNRAQKRGVLSGAEIEKMLGLPVAAEIPNDYKSVHKAIDSASPVDASSEIGKQFRELGRKLLSRPKAVAPARRFIEFFNLTPGKYSFDGSPAKQKDA